MTSRLHISTLVGIGALLWILVLWVRGNALGWEIVAPYGIVVSLVGVVVTAFDRWVWKWPILQGWFVQRPDMQGTWHVEINSDWINPETDENVEPVIGYMMVRQTLTKLSMRLMTQESGSWLEAHKIVRMDDGVFQVMGVYTNMPGVDLRGSRSEIHLGSLWLQVQGNPPDSLEGHYWTDRNTRGSLRLTQRTKDIYSTYEQAKKGFDHHISDLNMNE